MKKIIILITILFLTSCSVMTTNIMVGVTSEYEDRVEYYEQNQEYHHEYDIKFTIKKDKIVLSCKGLFYKELMIKVK